MRWEACKDGCFWTTVPSDPRGLKHVLILILIFYLNSINPSKYNN